ncbi:uncharacterized protein LOC110462547 isoform X1 [Mizuhopecten yessoensis]|uniref:uncharacterized protein LOC110462547 isoform X1 n=1 Tax=Mizuhopecten yessoensis TaxID=6573 RepID=UPI000B458891|nr:uncharacterized protein LOC110462547 isoform X1 [Mizuhopecten yessoensis]
MNTEQLDVIENSVTVEIKDKTEDINQFDSVSNVRSQPDRSRDMLAKQALKDSTNTQHMDSNKRVEGGGTTYSQEMVPHMAPPQKMKKVKRGIFISYSPDAGFVERKFVVDTVRQLKENNLAEDIWFDKDEKNTDSPVWFSLRMEAVEKCRASILFFSPSYFSCPVSMYESKTLLQRRRQDPHSVAIFPIIFSPLDNTDIPKDYFLLIKHAVDLSKDHFKKSLAEKTSVVIGGIMEELEKYASMNIPPTPVTPPDTEFTEEYKKKKICQWGASDLQEWLFNLGIKEFYRQSLAENMVDGFLLMSLTDHDMIQHLGIDSRVVRKKIMQQILITLDSEHKQKVNWHLRARALRAKPDVIYLVYDPADVRLAQNIKADLKKKNLQVVHHDSMKLGKSKEEFLNINGPVMATSSQVVVLLTEASTTSPFVFHEVLFADWLGKKLVTAMFKNVWTNFRASLKAVLGECPSVDFETKMYNESLDVLEHHIKPLRRVPGVVLEQAYLNKMAEGLKPLEVLGTVSPGGGQSQYHTDGEPQVFISYQWDMQVKVLDIKQMLENNGLQCWADITMASTTQPRGHSSKSSRSSVTLLEVGGETLQSQIQRNMKASAVVVCCITPKYLQSDNCKKDLTLAETFNKPIIPVLLRFSPLESAPDQVRKIITKFSCVDLSNDRLYKQHMAVVLERVKKYVVPRGYS